MSPKIWQEHDPIRVRAKLEFDPTDAENKRIKSIELTWHGHQFFCPYIKLYYKAPPGDNPAHHYFECVDEKQETYFRVRLDVKDQFVNVVGAAGPDFDS